MRLFSSRHAQVKRLTESSETKEMHADNRWTQVKMKMLRAIKKVFQKQPKQTILFMCKCAAIEDCER